MYQRKLDGLSAQVVSVIQELLSLPVGQSVSEAHIEIFLDEYGSVPSVWAYWHGKNNKVDHSDTSLFPGRSMQLLLDMSDLASIDEQYFIEPEEFPGLSLSASLLSRWFAECWWKAGGNAPEISSRRSQTEETFVEDVMGKQRQSWTVEEKLGIVLAVLSERQSVAEVSRQHGVNENQIDRWKEQFLAAGRQGLNGAKAQTADQRLDAENSQLKKLLGEKALEIEILKKVSRF